MLLNSINSKNIAEIACLKVAMDPVRHLAVKLQTKELVISDALHLLNEALKLFKNELNSMSNLNKINKCHRDKCQELGIGSRILLTCNKTPLEMMRDDLYKPLLQGFISSLEKKTKNFPALLVSIGNILPPWLMRIREL